jgi:uncharacterized protein YqjF (DUF2071 family)
MATFLTAHWRKLIMAQYEVSPETLAPWLPSGVDLDLYQDRHCFISLVGFLFDSVRIKGVAVPFHSRFEEVNLRFYVVRTQPDGTRRRGVVFIREFVPRAAITLIANTLYEEPYATLPTHSAIAATTDTLSVAYSWRHKSVWQSMSVEADPALHPIAANSVEEFITEHYWGYTKRRSCRTSQYEVRHPRWQIYAIRNHLIRADFGALYGPAFAHLDAGKPANILLAEGSAVSVGSDSTIG